MQYADESACVNPLQCVCEWLEQLFSSDPSLGYFPEPSKCFMMVFSKRIESAHDIFGDFSISITYCHFFLDGAICDSGGQLQFVQMKIYRWIKCVLRYVLDATTAASKYPQVILGKSLLW